MERSILTLLTCMLCATSLTLASEGFLASTKYGEVKGQNKLSKNGRLYHSFTGIPYAQPPIGELRFREPQEPDHWNFTRDATREPPVCIQRNYLFSSDPPIEGQEDCLYLNVFVPKMQIRSNYIPYERDRLLPVMVFLHWGGFIAGRSTTGYLGPDLFMDKDVVLVTFNYRLGPFGFLSTADDDAPGNYGLKDQVAALKWVQDNIAHFGGDKDNVTLFGQSAGAGSVHYHLLSSASEGLFHKAISQSGNALAAWALPLNDLQKQVTTLQASFVGCDIEANSTDTLNCLRRVPAETILKTQDYFRQFHGNPLAIFGAVVETKSDSNPRPFLTKSPLQYILEGKIKKVPWLTGVVKNEGVLRAASLLRPKAIREQLNENFEKLLTDVLLLLSVSATDTKSLYRNITQFYLGGREYINASHSKSVQGLIDVYSDRAFVYPLYQSLILHSRQGHSPIFVYNFEYEGINSYTDHFSFTQENISHHWGTCHCDDLLYLFTSPDLFTQSTADYDNFMSRILVTLWTNFAKFGDPSPPENAVHANIRWRALNITGQETDMNKQIELLNITGNSKVGPKLEISRGFHKERMKFWTDSDIFENAGLK